MGKFERNVSVIHSAQFYAEGFFLPVLLVLNAVHLEASSTG